MKTTALLIGLAFVCCQVHGAAFFVGLGLMWAITVIGANRT